MASVQSCQRLQPPNASIRQHVVWLWWESRNECRLQDSRQPIFFSLDWDRGTGCTQVQKKRWPFFLAVNTRETKAAFRGENKKLSRGNNGDSCLVEQFFSVHG
jgi:hypothetical protein